MALLLPLASTPVCSAGRGARWARSQPQAASPEAIGRVRVCVATLKNAFGSKGLMRLWSVSSFVEEDKKESTWGLLTTSPAEHSYQFYIRDAKLRPPAVVPDWLTFWELVRTTAPVEPAPGPLKLQQIFDEPQTALQREDFARDVQYMEVVGRSTLLLAAVVAESARGPKPDVGELEQPSGEILG